MLNLLDVQAPSGLIYRFADFRLDVSRRLLAGASGILPLPERTFQILLMLVESGGKIVEREAIAQTIWPDTAVSDGNIAQHVYILRKILGEHARDRGLVMAVNRRGYRLTVPVALEEGAAAAIGSTVHGAAEGIEALDFAVYLEGSFLVERRTGRALHRALDIFESSLRRNPNQVSILVGLARAYAFLAKYGHVPPATGFEKAKEAARHALTIDPSSAVARSVLACLLLDADWDWVAAKAEVDAAARSNPNASIVSCSLVDYLLSVGEHDRALAEARRALMMEPSSLIRQFVVGVALIHAGSYRQGVTCMSRLLEIDETSSIARRYRALGLLLLEEPQEALTGLLLFSQERVEDHNFQLSLLARAYADSGERTRAEEVYGTLRMLSAGEYVPSWNLALVAVGIGRLEEALAHLRSAFEQREPAILSLPSLRLFGPLEGDESYREILRAIERPAIR